MDVYLMYLRKSRADEAKESLGQHETLSLHRERLTAMCRQRGYFVEEVFEELVSGESISARKEFQRLMEHVQTRRYRGVVVHAVDRLGRGDMMEYGWVLSTFQYTGTLIVTPERAYDPSVRDDCQILQMQMFFANNELSFIKKRLKDGKESHAARGEHIASRAPLGYRKAVLPDGRKTLEPDEWAPTVEQIYRDVAAGAKLWPMSVELQRQGVPGSWHNQRIKSLVSNPVYKGLIGWNQVVTVIDSREGMEFKKKRVKGGSAATFVPGLHQAIVSEELWDAANAMIGLNPRGPHGPLVNPLAGLLRCSKCGRAMSLSNPVIRKGRPLAYFRHPYNTGCSAAGARKDVVMDVLADALAGYASADAVARVALCDAEASATERGNLERLAAECDRRCAKLMDLYMADGISAHEYRELREVEESRKAAAMDRLAEMSTRQQPDAEFVSMGARDALEMIRGDIQAQALNDLLKTFVERIDYSNDGTLSLRVYMK